MAIALVVASTLAGVLWFRFSEDVRGLWRDLHPRHVAAAPEPFTTTLSHVRGVVLFGPNARIVAIPQATTAVVVNVWLQGCADCMPAFDAYNAIATSGGLGVGVPVINVAYGQADVAWAAKYHVDENLVFDAGGALVKPLGIGSFTTLVIDPQGAVVLVDRPDRVGYAARVGDAVRRLGYPDRVTPKPRAATPDGKSVLTVICFPACDHVIDNGRDLGASPTWQASVPSGMHKVDLVAGRTKKRLEFFVADDELKTIKQTMGD